MHVNRDLYFNMLEKGNPRGLNKIDILMQEKSQAISE